MNPQYGIPVLINYGNGQSTNGAPPAINEALTGAFRLTRINPPTITPPKLPVIERLTPRSMNAEKLARTNMAMANTTIRTYAQRTVRAAQGYANRVAPNR